jgi:hypothetical protein
MQGDDFKIQNFLKLGGAVTALCALLSGCLTQDQPPKLGPTNANTESSTNSGDSVHATGANTYTNAKSTKVIFNKKSFFTNFSPNSFGCPGDAQYYYSPETDRIVPSKPSWLKNISVDITNTNAINGPSRATGCGVYGGGAPPAANCATFDDLQPLDGLVSRSVLIGGIGCSSPGTNCTSTSTLSDIWHLQITDQATTTTWAPQAAIMPIISGTIPGTAWSGGDFDTLHDQFYVFGGAYDGGGTYTFTNKVVASYFNSDGTLSTANAPQTLAAGTPVYYGSWTSAAFVAGLANPIARVGATFTYSPRRDPTFKSWCPRGDGNCFSNTQAANAAVVNNENHDYFLMLGGMTTANTLSSEVYMYKPHGFSADVGTNSPSQGDWNLLSNDLLGGVRGSIMKIIDISTQISTGVGKFQGTTVNGTMPIGTTFSGLLPRAFHRSVYDPTMNRFYIYGGIKTSAGVNVTTVTPDLSSELWVYDPPALGRKPTSICSMTTSPEGNTLPTTVLSTRTRLGPNLNYSTNASVFPPGGCLQRISLQQSTPEARFEHAMAFDSDQKAVVVFGGCKQASTIATSGAALGGDPILFQHFFWFYSHPAVYIMILPAMGVISEVIPVFSRKPIFGYKAIALATFGIALVSFIVWGHHMFVSGQSEMANFVFSLITMFVAVPTGVKVFSWIGTLYKGQLRFKAPLLYAYNFLFVFTIGGLTGVYLAVVSTNVHLTDTYFVIAHFHYVMVGGTINGFLAGIHYWFPKVFGKMYSERASQVAWAFIFLGFNITFFPQFILGSQGMPRRYWDYLPEFTTLNQISTIGSWFLLTGFVLTAIYLGKAMKSGAPAGDNPWESLTLEWQSASPPPHDNFSKDPVVTHGFYEYDPNKA